MYVYSISHYQPNKQVFKFFVTCVSFKFIQFLSILDKHHGIST